MASIFLSYAREDGLKAKALARCLERAGHKVWWDRHIHGGAEFAGEIEQALRSAEVVIVLWSEASIRSSWVRDEAAEGRDSGRLLPIILDASAPPLGFRQLQSIPITGWSGRGNPPHWQEILDAIAARSGATAKPAGEPTTSARTRKPMTVGLAALGALLLAVGAWWLLEGRGKAAEPPVLAVLPFSDLSPERDKAYFAEGVAEAILSVLAKEPGIRVVGRSTAQQLHDAGAQAGKMRRELGITHILEGSARSLGDQLRMSVRLIDASDGQQLWAEEYQRRLDNVFAVQDEIGRAVAQRLKGSFAGRAEAAQQLTSADAYALYLAARAKMRDRKTSSLKEALELAKRVIAADPKYAPGHALIAELMWHLSEESYGSFPHDRAVAIANQHARRAIALAPKAPEGHAALGLISSDQGSTRKVALEALTTAIRLDPARAELRLWLASNLNGIARHQEALEQLRSVVETEPLWGTGVSQYAYTLAASERYDEAEAMVAKFEQRGGSPAVAARIRSDVANYRGDFSNSIRFLSLALKEDPETPLGGFSRGWYYYMVGLPLDAAVTAKGTSLLERLFFEGDDRRMAQAITSAGPQLWKQRGGGLAIEWLAFRRDWSALERLYDRHPEGASAFCDENPFAAISVAKALDVVGRSAESRKILECLKRVLRREGRGPVRSAYWPAGTIDLLWAQVHALEGRPQQAFPLLQRSISRGVRTSYGRGLSEFPVFDAYRATDEYRSIDSRLKQLMAIERSETLRLLQNEMRNQRRAA